MVPYFGPSSSPEIITPIFCKTIGTGIKPSGIGGNKPKTIRIAVITAAIMKPLVFRLANVYTSFFGTFFGNL